MEQAIKLNLIPNETCKTINNVDEIFHDIQIYRNQLRETHGSIRIQTHAFQLKQCCCGDNQSSHICREIIKFENELFQSNSVEYIYPIECTNDLLC